MLELLATLIVLPPLAAAAAIGAGLALGLIRGEGSEPATARIAIGAGGLSVLAVLGLDLASLLTGAPGQVRLGTWLSAGEVQVPLSFTLDGLGLAMASLVAPICLLTVRFSVAYLHREAGFHRFFLCLTLFAGAMLLIVTAGNALLAFVGWELAGISSYLLIAYSCERDRAAEGATRAFITNRIGDAGFLLAVFLCLHWLGGLEWPEIAAGAAGLERLRAGLILLAFLLPALAKSAVLPFSAWLGRALEGPTPSSAVFYGSLMVHAGVYLVIRLEPLLGRAPSVGTLLVLLGLATALYGALAGLTRADVKSSLVLATTTQVGLMVMECGLGWFQLATWHLALHALWRAYQLLHAPDFLYLTTRPARPVPRWLRHRRRLYAAAVQDFWLDPIADWLLVRPTRDLARDVRAFDEEVVDRLAGLPVSATDVAGPGERDEHKAGAGAASIVQGRGLLGWSLQRLADLLYAFEEHLVLGGGGEGLKRGLDRLGRTLQRVEELLGQPRYLLLLILGTLVIIL